MIQNLDPIFGEKYYTWVYIGYNCKKIMMNMALPNTNYAYILLRGNTELTYFLPSISKQRSCFAVVQEQKASFHEAKHHCASMGKVVLGGTALEEEAKLKEVLVINNWETAWMNLEEKSLGFLTWSNGQKVDGRIFDQADAKCGFIDLPEKESYETYCLFKLNFFCGIEDCAFCPPSFDDCIRMNGSCYFFGDSISDWYEAHNSCRVYGGTSAVAPALPLIDKLVDVLWHKRGIKSLWLGSRTTDWVTNDGKDYVTEYNWLHGQPNVNHKCVVLAKSDGKIGWKTQPCNTKANFVCTHASHTTPFRSGEHDQAENVTESIVTKDLEKVKTFPENGSAERHHDPLFFVGLILVALSGLLLVFVPCAVVVYKKIGGHRSEPSVHVIKKLRCIMKHCQWGKGPERDQDQFAQTLNQQEGQEDPTIEITHEETHRAQSSGRMDEALLSDRWASQTMPATSPSSDSESTDFL